MPHAVAADASDCFYVDDVQNDKRSWALRREDGRRIGEETLPDGRVSVALGQAH